MSEILKNPIWLDILSIKKRCGLLEFLKYLPVKRPQNVRVKKNLLKNYPPISVKNFMIVTLLGGEEQQ